jgi:hypothetical protein
VQVDTAIRLMLLGGELHEVSSFPWLLFHYQHTTGVC